MQNYRGIYQNTKRLYHNIKIAGAATPATAPTPVTPAVPTPVTPGVPTPAVPTPAPAGVAPTDTLKRGISSIIISQEENVNTIKDLVKYLNEYSTLKEKEIADLATKYKSSEAQLALKKESMDLKDLQSKMDEFTKENEIILYEWFKNLIEKLNAIFESLNEMETVTEVINGKSFSYKKLKKSSTDIIESLNSIDNFNTFSNTVQKSTNKIIELLTSSKNPSEIKKEVAAEVAKNKLDDNLIKQITGFDKNTLKKKGTDGSSSVTGTETKAVDSSTPVTETKAIDTSTPVTETKDQLKDTIKSQSKNLKELLNLKKTDEAKGIIPELSKNIEKLRKFPLEDKEKSMLDKIDGEIGKMK